MVWDATNIFLFAANILTVLYILYNDAVIPLWKGKTVLSVKLRSRGRWDGYIFVGIIVLLFVSNTFFREGPFSTSVLLGIMVCYSSISASSAVRKLFSKNPDFFMPCYSSLMQKLNG